MSDFSAASAMIRDSICKKLITDLDNTIFKLTRMSEQVKKVLKRLKKTCVKTSFTPSNLIGTWKVDVSKDLPNIAPSLSDTRTVDEILAVITQCFLGGNPFLCNPLSFLRNLNDAATQRAKGILDDLSKQVTGGIVMPEIGIAVTMDSLYDGFDLGVKIPDMFDLIACLGTVCSGYDISGRVTTINTLMSQMFMDVDGNFDASAFLDTVNITPIARLGILDVYETLSSTYDSVGETIGNAVNMFTDSYSDAMDSQCI